VDHPLSPLQQPIVIAHRGASGYLPEHTLPAYLAAIEQGADFVEPDLVMSRDGHLLARHDNVLNLTTDVAEHPKFAGRKTTKAVDGAAVEGWFSEDFTLAELKTLRAIERIPDVRPANARFNRLFEIPTLQEIIELVQAMERARGRRIGIYPETKHPSYFAALSLPLESALIDVLHRYGYGHAHDPIFIQSFEVSNLKRLKQMTELRLVQLLWLEGKPFDVELEGGALSYDAMATAEGLRAVASYADGVGPEKYHFIIPPDAAGIVDSANRTRFVADAHAAGLLVHPYTFRAENAFLPTNFKGPNPGKETEFGNVLGEITAFLEAGIDGFFVDQADIGVRALKARAKYRGLHCAKPPAA
jgi:glycerophosphoryl diester phosphodiesterase